MRVTFERPDDHQRASVLIERDDGVVYRLDAGPITAEIPHDLVHFTVEDALGIADGIWGAIAGGVVFRSMTHVSGRRPPHAGELSAALIKTHREHLQRAEFLGAFIEQVAEEPDAEQLRLLLGAFRSRLSLPPNPADIARAVAALRASQQRWRKVPVGGQLVLNWPSERRMTTRSALRVHGWRTTPSVRRPSRRSRTGRR